MRIAGEQKDLPNSWYNIIPDLPFAMSPMMGLSGYPVGFHDLQPILASALIEQELEMKKREVTIPEEVLRFYSLWRPTPIYRAEKFEQILGTPARIFYKYEGSNPSGSYEMNTAIAQAYYTSRDKNIKGIVTATGNGEWGESLAIAANFFGIKCKVYMVKSGYDQKEAGRYAMEILGAEVVSSPSNRTKTGRKILSDNPDSIGSLSIALSEAFEDALTNNDLKFSWGTVMNHVVLHQSIIGIESENQLKRANIDPDILISSVSGGSGFGGLVFPFFRTRRQGRRMIAVETSSAPSLTRGKYAYDYSDSEGLAPMLKMYTLGHDFVPPGIRAGGMRYHGISPIISALYREKLIEARAYSQKQAFEAAIAFARSEGLIPSPETAYTIKAVMDEAAVCKENHQNKNILFLLNGNSSLDLVSFKDFVEGAIGDEHTPEEEINRSLQRLPEVKTG